jgi:hypothetical protein
MPVYGAAASPGESAAYAAAQAAIGHLGRPIPASEMYTRLESAYYNGQTFDELVGYIERAMGANSPRRVKALRSPAFRVVEFYATHIWPGESLDEAFTFQTGGATLEKAIRQVWTWSNFGAKRSMFARRFAMLGNLFIGVRQSEDKSRVFFRYIDPRWVTRYLFDDQDRGYLTYARLDIPQQRIDENGDVADYWVTEIWDKDRNLYQRWVHGQGAEASPDVMGNPTHNGQISQLFGIDFIPIVHALFRDDAAGLGLGAYQLQLGKIDEANRLCTELHAKLFRHNQPTFVVTANSIDRTGRPMAAPRIPGLEGYTRQGQNPGITYGTNGTQDTPGPVSDVVVANIGDEQWIYLPGNATIEDLIPKIAWADALAVLVDYIDELAEDMPEMVYSQIKNMPGDASGEALRIRLMAAVDRALEARANILPALIRANQMAITIGQNGGLFENVGAFKDGALDHTLSLLPVIPQNDLEKLDADGKRAANAVVKDQAGWPRRTILTEAGYTPREAETMMTARDDQNATQIDIAQRAFSRGNNVDGLGGNPGDGSTNDNTGGANNGNAGNSSGAGQ